MWSDDFHFKMLKHEMICVVNYTSICSQTVEATFFSLKVIVIVGTWQVTYSGSCTNVNYTSDLPRLCGQANTITPFYRSFASDIKTKEQVALRAITGTEDLIHACSWPVLQPLLIILNFLCSLKSGKRVCSADCWRVPTARVSVCCRTFWCVMLKPHWLCD